MKRRVALVALVVALGSAAALVPLRAGAQPHIGEVRILAFNFCPAGWAEANGQLLSIAENDTLFNLYDTTFGGDGETTFAMPDLRGRLPIGTGTGIGLTPRVLGEQGGSEQVTLTAQQMPAHTHAAGASSQAANAVVPSNVLRGTKLRTPFHRTGVAANTTLAADAVAPSGASQPAPNVAPFTTLRVCVSLFGVFPSQP